MSLLIANMLRSGIVEGMANYAKPLAMFFVWGNKDQIQTI